MRNQEPKQTENVDDDNQEEEKSDEDESDKEVDQNEEEGGYGKEGGDIDLSEDPDVDNEDFLGTKQKSLVKRFTPSDVVKPATYQKKCLKMVFSHYLHTSSAMIVRSNCMDQN